MKLAMITALSGILLVSHAHAEEHQVVNSPMDKLNYGIGVETARNLKNQGVDVNLDLLIQGLKDGLSGKPLLVPDKELRGAIVSFQSELRRRQAMSRRVAAMDNLSTGATSPRPGSLH